MKNIKKLTPVRRQLYQQGLSYGPEPFSSLAGVVGRALMIWVGSKLGVYPFTAWAGIEMTPMLDPDSILGQLKLANANLKQHYPIFQ